MTELSSTSSAPGGRIAEAFSVLIPAHRAAGYITETLLAVARQTVQPAEILIYEDGRFDDLADRVNQVRDQFACPVRLLGEPVNQGVSFARNHLLRVCRGEWIAFLDADDIWEPDHLERAAASFRAGADVCFCGVSFIDPAGQALLGLSGPTPTDLEDIASSIFRYNFVQCTSTLVMRAEWIDRVGDFDTTLSHGEDLDLWLRLLAAGADFRYTGAHTCRYRKHPASAMANTLKMVERMGAFYEKHLHNPLIRRRQRRRALIGNRLVQARLHWTRQPEKSAAALSRLIQLQPWNPRHVCAWAIARWRSRHSAGRAQVPLSP